MISQSMRCLLCDHLESRIVSTLTGAELRTLFLTARHAMSDEALGAITPGYIVELHECTQCGFQFFDPALAGSGKFYEELDAGAYYPAARPEFAFALERLVARGASSVLDIGGGDGAFLDLARQRGLRTFGAELNEQAREAARAKGHIMQGAGGVEAESEVDAITLFQVVEHLPDPRGFLRTALRRLRAGGLVVLAVPNRDGVFRLLPLDPANLPPHHVSRWRALDLRRLGEACGLRWIEDGADVLYGSALAEFWRLQNRLALALGRRPHPGGAWLPTVVSQLYRKLGCRHFFPRRGLGIYAVFEKESAHGR